MPSAKTELLAGTLEMLVLKTLTVGPMHGYGIAQHLGRVSGDALRVEEGTLYPALQRMRQKGWIKAEWKQTPNNQRARYYRLTPPGRRYLTREQSRWKQLVEAVHALMHPRALND